MQLARPWKLESSMSFKHLRIMGSVRLVVVLLLLPFLFSAEKASVAGERELKSLGDGKSWQTAVYINDSDKPGPVVIVIGGVHGNEPAGARAAYQIRHWPIQKGKLIVIPQLNVAALDANTRFTPDAIDEEKDLNRNFPYLGIAEHSRGEIAKEVWQFVVDQNPDWLFDLHEGYEFNVSHQPKSGQAKSVGSTIICDVSRQSGAMTQRMLAAANQLVSDPDRQFVLKGRGPKKTTLAAAVINVLDKPAMILETTHQFQRLPVRTRQHRAMMNAALRQLGMIDADCLHLMTPAGDIKRQKSYVAVYDDSGASERGVKTVTGVLENDCDIEVAHLDARDIREEILSQFDVVLFGGGSGSKEAAAIGSVGSEAVRHFVMNGGGYVGICAGAYLCSAHYKWSLNLIDTHVFTGTKQVEGLGPKSMWYRGGVTTQRMQLTERGQDVFEEVGEHLRVRYHNGPIVSPRGMEGLNPYTVLSWFRSEKVLYPPQEGTMINTPAIVIGDYGKGKVISISPHPESTDGLESMLPSAIRAVRRMDSSDF